ncbi:heterokaryon incompatibility protein-domain-containing protein [Hypomontagnella submonticulosa]|nr:heterokaryon incompatibility protein-domain-containing protein [Hypomontagnella submonticulosa]
MEGGCNICRAIWLGFADTDSVDNIDLGSFEEALSSPCPIHTPLIQMFRDYCQQGQSRGLYPSGMVGSSDVGIIPRKKSRSASIRLSLSKLGLFWNLLLVNRTSVPNHPGTGRLLDPDWVDIDVLPRWKHKCLTEHGTRCENPLKIWPTRPAWLIDVERKCLVSGHKCDGAFVALSYRYGDHRGAILDAATLSKLQEPKVLDTPEMSPYLSPIVRHAMYVTSVIGERYLWADSLCISQHDRDAATRELELMAAIYGNAVVTIIAADTDAIEGLPGLKGVSDSRKLEQKVIPFGKEQLAVRNTGVFSMTNGTPYYNRAWTYQEYAHSSRKLLFNRKEVHWQCSCSVWHEELNIGEEIDMYIDPRMRTILAGFPDMGSMNHVLTAYNEREHRHDEDALPAISGLLSVASRSFTGGFLYGLPEMFFECALGWRRFWGHTNLRRRIPSQRPIESRLHPSQLPSWSWIGWHGLVTAGYGEAARINNRQHSIQETFPITEWYTADSPSATMAQRRRIRSTWFTDRESYKESYKDLKKPLPLGWTRLEPSAQVAFRGEPFLYPDGCGEFIFKHEAMTDPDEEINYWYYPFPVTTITESTPPFMPEQTAYLFCETQQARLWARGINNSIHGKNTLCLLNAEKRQVGVLYCDNVQQLEGFPDAVGDTEKDNEVLAGRQVELVAIYRFKKYMKTWDEEKKRYDYPLTTSESIVVLWVEWVDGVAYRLASGDVEREAWEELPLERISLVMG